ncbi:uncharacterized protein LOC100864066 isoform X2 [Apis florea]|uniref:uncharacterized protein LOC100864066 isoform X2 n=1 Tax=Apis florea TaxID=7463 RepID=UPI0012FF1D0F|nr:uncharacterized protein LOC100864066 isoform X2 [Apis florea]
MFRSLPLGAIAIACSFVWRSESILLYPNNSLFQFTIGVSVPVSMNKRGSVVFSSAFQFNYKLPSNLSQLEPTIMLARQARDLNLQDAYEAIENLLDRHGWEDGRECLLKTICELAETPFGRTRRDVLEEVIHLILTTRIYYTTIVLVDIISRSDFQPSMETKMLSTSSNEKRRKS